MSIGYKIMRYPILTHTFVHVHAGLDVGFSEMSLDPSDVDVTDLEIAYLSESRDSNLSHLLQVLE